MKLALVLGTQQGNSVKPRLQGIKDNLDIDCYANILQFVDTAIKRNSMYERILVLSTMMDGASINALFNYITSFAPSTQVVTLCRKGTDESTARLIMQKFMNPNVTAMLVQSTTVSIIAEAVLRPVKELTEEYGIQDFMTMEVEEVFYTPNIVEQEVSVPEESPLPAESDKGKRTFFSALLGSKPRKTKQPKMQDMTAGEDESVLAQPEFVVENTQNDKTAEIGVENNDTFTSEAVTNQSPSSDNTNEVPKTSELRYSFPTKVTKKSGIKKGNATVKVPSGQAPADKETNSKQESVEVVEQPLSSSLPVVEDDVELGTFAEESDDISSEVNSELGTIEDDDLTGVDFFGEEQSYNKTNDAPKVVTKTVVKEVIRNVGEKKDAYPILQSLLEQRLKRVILVTGDRGTGITSTALNIAKRLSEKIPVLYFDCDIFNHGLLNYIDYGTFATFEETHMNGVKVCKSSAVFDRCVVSYDDNFDILTSDFSCDATVEDLEKTHEVVHERAGDYGAVIVDCPIDCLPYVTDFLIVGNTILCVEGSKRGFMNMLCRLESSSLPVRFKKSMITKGFMLVTKCPKTLDLSKLVKYIRAIFEVSTVDWLAIQMSQFNGVLTDKLLNDILEG